MLSYQIIGMLTVSECQKYTYQNVDCVGVPKYILIKMSIVLECRQIILSESQTCWSDVKSYNRKYQLY